MSGKMKKIRGMLDGLRQSVGSSSPKSEAEIEETLRSEDLQVCKVRFPIYLSFYGSYVMNKRARSHEIINFIFNVNIRF